MGSFSLVFLVVFILSPVAIALMIGWRFREAGVLSYRPWRTEFKRAWFINLVSFTSLALYFQYRYGFITDDINYYYGADGFAGKMIWELKGGTEFMFFLVKPLKHFFGFDRPTFHAFFATLGFLASLNFLYVASMRTDMLREDFFKDNRIMLFSLICFPNIMLWGRVFGKDSSMFLLVSIFVLSAVSVLGVRQAKPLTYPLLAFTLYIMQIIRPHVAGVVGAAFIIAYLIRLLRFQTKNLGAGAIVKLYLPLALMAVLVVFISSSIQKLGVESEEMSMQAIRETIVNASRMGGYGGSSTDLASEMRDNPEIIFQPLQVAKNILNLLFAPLPWQIRGGADMIAFVSNVLLFYLLYKYLRNIKMFDPSQWFFLLATVGLTLLLSFMTGNVGLILRQKTIILPFLFLLLFSRPPEEPPPEYDVEPAEWSEEEPVEQP